MLFLKHWMRNAVQCFMKWAEKVLPGIQHIKVIGRSRDPIPPAFSTILTFCIFSWFRKPVKFLFRTDSQGNLSLPNKMKDLHGRFIIVYLYKKERNPLSL